MGRLASCLTRGSVSHFTSALRQDTSFVLDHPGVFSSSQHQLPTAARAVVRPRGARNPARIPVGESRLAGLSSLLLGRGHPALEASVGGLPAPSPPWGGDSRVQSFLCVCVLSNPG